MADHEVKRTEVTREEDLGPESHETRHTTEITESDGVARGSSIAKRLVYFLLGLIETILAFRVLLTLLGANRANAFADFIYDISRPFAQPFFTLFGYDAATGELSRLELGTIVAMIVYAVVAWGILALINVPRRNGTM